MRAMPLSQPAGLISVLRDTSARPDERDDAAIGLGRFDEPEALAVLVEVASDSEEDDNVVASAGESIAEIWQKSGGYDDDLVAGLTATAQREIRAYFPGRDPAGRG